MIDNYDKQFEQFEMQKQKIPQYFDQPEHIKKHLLDISEYQTIAVNHDLGRANFNPKELKETYANGDLILEFEEAELMCGFDLTQQKMKTHGKIGLRAVSSRSKAGWGPSLAITDKQISVNQMEEMANDISDQFNPEIAQQLKPSFLDRFKRRV